MIPADIFQSLPFSGLNLATLLLYAGLSILFFLLPFRLIYDEGLSATQAGLVFMPFTLMVGFGSGFFGDLAGRISSKALLIAGPLFAAAGFALFAILAGGNLITSALLPMAVTGTGFAMLLAPLTSEVMNSVDDEYEGLASGINNTASRVAQMLGVAIAAIFVGLTQGYALGMLVSGGLAAAATLAVLLTLPTGVSPDTSPQRKRAEG